MPFNPQPGDRVTIRTWDDMAEEYGLNRYGQIKAPYISILKDMKQFCGHSYIVKAAFHISEPDRRSYSFYDVPFYFPICALAGYSSSSQSIPPSPISFDSLLQPLTTP